MTIMPPLVVGLLLDDGGRTMLRWAPVVAALACTIVFVIVAAPALMVAAVFAGPQSGQTATVAASDGNPAPAAIVVHPASAGSLSTAPPMNAAVDVGRHYLGVPYVFGGTNPAVGLDCSGLVQLVFRQLGVVLPRTAQAQFDATARVAVDDLQPGDLVFFARTYVDPHDWITHVGIYLGNGLQLNAPTEGQVVSIQPVFTGYWGAHFAAGGRIRGR
ncbi:MAG: hypothetical protein NVSMB2_21210 [Chloroflexota bacterium]